MFTWPDLYLRHFTRFFGKPFDVQVYRQEDGGVLRLATFDQAFPNYRVYASLGLSGERGRAPICEAILIVDDPGKDVPYIFANALSFVRERGIALRPGVVIGGVEMIRPDFVEYFDKAALCFTEANDIHPGLESLQRGPESGEVLQAVFVSWAEQDFINRKGLAEFETRLKQQEADPCSLNRPSCV